MTKEHQYQLTIKWTGNTGQGTCDYRSYERAYQIAIENKPEITGSSGTAFNADHTKHNPEDMLLAALSSCHMLSYLYVCAKAGIVVTAYSDEAKGTLLENNSGGGEFTEVVLNPLVKVSDAGMVAKANELHHEAGKVCYIANSVNFPITYKPICTVS